MITSLFILLLTSCNSCSSPAKELKGFEHQVALEIEALKKEGSSLCHYSAKLLQPYEKAKIEIPTDISHPKEIIVLTNAEAGQVKIIQIVKGKEILMKTAFQKGRLKLSPDNYQTDRATRFYIESLNSKTSKTVFLSICD